MPIIAGVAVVLSVVIVLVLWSQKKSQEYDDAFRKGMKEWQERQAERALANFRKAAKIDPSDPELWVMIGRCELVSGRIDDALKAWEDALKREPGYKGALFERGKEAFGRHIARRIPAPVDASSGWLPTGLEPIARVEGGSAELQKIQDDLKAGAGQAPEFARFARGATHLVDGQYREAQPYFQAYSDANPWDSVSLALIGIAGRYGVLPNRAEQSLTAALALRADPSWFRVRAETRYLQANYEGARADYKDAGMEKEAEPLFARRIPTQGLTLWLKADAGVEVSGSSVSKWVDQSDAHQDAAPKEPSGGPKLSASAIRGRPAILFGGGEEELRLPDGFEDFGAGLSLYVVGEPMAESTEPWSFVFLATPARGAGRIEVLLGRRRESEQVVFASEDVQSGANPFIAGLAPGKGFEQIGAIQDPSGMVRLYKRGELLASGKLLLPRKTPRTRNRVGAGYKGQIAEILLYKRSLSELERLGVEAYLKDRYFPDKAAVPAATDKR